jgi:hypothetical protein
MVADESVVTGGVLALARSLRQVRLLSCVVAVADPADEAGGDRGSHMAAVSMVNDRGQKGLLAFTGVDSLAAWSPTARPVPALGRQMAQAAISDGSYAVVIDVEGPHRRVIAGAALRAMADELDFDVASGLVLAALSHIAADERIDIEVVDARQSGSPADMLVTLTSRGAGGQSGRELLDLAMRVARLLEGRDDISAHVPGGIGVTTASSGGGSGA